MRRTKRSAGVVGIIGLALMIGLTMATSPTVGKEPAKGKKAAAAKAKKERANHGRLPAYFSKIADEELRAKIYEIQKEYNPKMRELQQQLTKLREERDAKIMALLTPEQKKQLEELRAAAKAKKKKAREAKPTEE
ncbi:MAG: hypothetical protein JW818_10635 [Pirellulales bacterium]|nr:hypothetical protein [Pirellulales bacterium]